MCHRLGMLEVLPALVQSHLRPFLSRNIHKSAEPPYSPARLIAYHIGYNTPPGHLAVFKEQAHFVLATLIGGSRRKNALIHLPIIWVDARPDTVYGGHTVSGIEPIEPEHLV